MVDQIPEEEIPSPARSICSPDTRFDHELVALNEIGWALSQSLDLDRVVEMALETTLRVLDSQAGCIHLSVAPGAGELRLQIHTGLPTDLSQRIAVIPQDDSDLQRVIESGRPMVVPWDDVPQDVELPTAVGHDPPPDAPGLWVSFPLLARDQLQGLMSVFIGELTPDRTRLLRTIGQHVGMAIANAQLYRRTQQYARRLRREAELWHALNRAAVAVSGMRGEQDVYDAVTHTLSSLGFSAIVITSDPNTQALTVASFTTPLPKMVRALERLTGLPLAGYQLPHDRCDFYRRIIEQGQTEFVELGVEHIAQMLPESFIHLVPGIVRRVGLEYGIAAPLQISGQTIALLIVAGKDLSIEDVPTVTVFADQASTAIENARLIEAERRQREVAEMLRDLVATVNSTLDVDQVLDIAVRRLQALHQATACSVSFLTEDGKTFVFRATTDPGIDVSQHITFPADRSVGGLAVRERQVQIVNDVDQSPDYRAEITQRTHIVGRSLLTAPLFAGDKPLGVIQVLSASPNAFNQADAELLATTAALIETAVARAQAYTQAVQLAQAEHRQREVAETLRRVAILIGASLDLDTVLDRILEQLAHVVDYDSASLMLVEDDKLIMRAIRGFEEPDQILSLVSDVEDNPLFQEMLASRLPIVVSDVQTDNRFRHWAGTKPIHSWIGMPLVIRDRVIGQLAVDKHQPGLYDEDDAELAFTFAQQAATAIENARLHQALQEYAAELEARVEARTAEVNRERERLLAVLESAGDAIAITNANGIIEYANPAWEQLTGYEVAQAIQQKARIFDDKTFPDFLVTEHSFAQGQRVWRSELTGKRPDGTTYSMDLTITPILDESEELVNMVVIYRDVTKYKELERIKSEFLSTAAHELRSPLTAIMGFSELLRTRQDLTNEEQARFLDYIYSHTIHLKRLVNDLLDISRIESGQSFTVNLEPLDLYSLFEQEIRSWQEANPDYTYHLRANSEDSALHLLARAAARPGSRWRARESRQADQPPASARGDGLGLPPRLYHPGTEQAGWVGRTGGPSGPASGQAPPTGWPKVRADRDRISQVMRNLLSNATKYSSSGGTITVSAASVGGYVEVTVADEGIGMTDEELSHLFKKFWRADASPTAAEGTGLGLVIVKYIVEQHGGQIWVESAKNKGTVVHFTLPQAERQTTVLIVDDEEPVREIEKRILTNNGIATLAAGRGEEAIEMAQAHRPDLILLDLMMPGMSGRDVLHTLKSIPATEHIPVLVVSAHSGWQTIEETYMLGAIDFLTKPFEYEELLSRVRRALKITSSKVG